MNSSNRIRSYPPVIDDACTVLILGTMPSVRSLEDGFYYAHPRNAFWPIMADVLGEARPRTVEEKKSLLLRHGIALWDTVASCVREGSLDADMREIVPNDIASLLRAHPNIRRVLLNGGEAHRLFRRALPDPPEGLVILRLPSTSPAYTLGFEKKRDAWREALGDEAVGSRQQENEETGNERTKAASVTA